LLNTKSILKEEILSFLSESKQYDKSRKFLLENSESFSDHVFNEQFRKLFLEALDYDSHFKKNPDVEDNLRQVALEFRNIAPELSKKYQQFVNNSIQNPLDRTKKTIWDYRNFIDSWQDNEAFGKALHMAARKINPESFGISKQQSTKEQPKPEPQQAPVSSPSVPQSKQLSDEEKVINQFLKMIDMKGFIEKWIVKHDEALTDESKEAILEYCQQELFPDHLLSESQNVKISKERLAQIIKEEMK